MARAPKAASGKSAAPVRPRGGAAAAGKAKRPPGRPPRAPAAAAAAPRQRGGSDGGGPAPKQSGPVTVDVRVQLREFEATVTREADEVVRDKVNGRSIEAVTKGKAAIKELDRSHQEALENAEATFEERHLNGAKATKEFKPQISRAEQMKRALEGAMNQANAAVDKHHQAWSKRFKAQMEKLAKSA